MEGLLGGQALDRQPLHRVCGPVSTRAAPYRGSRRGAFPRSPLGMAAGLDVYFLL